MGSVAPTSFSCSTSTFAMEVAICEAVSFLKSSKREARSEMDIASSFTRPASASLTHATDGLRGVLDSSPSPRPISGDATLQPRPSTASTRCATLGLDSASLRCKVQTVVSSFFRSQECCSTSFFTDCSSEVYAHGIAEGVRARGQFFSDGDGMPYTSLNWYCYIPSFSQFE
eukprot:CAMPEP_0172726206 /NCGR_PEP_ID=MMETSP1074-20121228/90157_1 /TAXON_ID=2916 /ORGANISM="Ceratium fusus, Strain PA161109" /LENGTH=171 /DNA_ID=CAMNT_0013553159 /DNA_START=522 /DNA_END=1034 /DNA_ORIENTATION=-